MPPSNAGLGAGPAAPFGSASSLGLTSAAIGIALLATLGGCAHRSRPEALSEASRRLGREAAQVGAIKFEEDYIEAKQVFRALPLVAPERAGLRARLLTYLLSPLAPLSTDASRRKSDPISDDDLDRLVASFRDALDLYHPLELWQEKGTGVPAGEKTLLAHAARLMVSLFSPRGGEVEVATALLVLATLEPDNRAHADQLGELLPWLETGAQLSIAGGGPKEIPSVTDALESAASVWPAPSVVEKLDRAYLKRQDRIATILRRPLGAPPSRPAVGELLLDGDNVQNTAMNLAGLYLRAGQLLRAPAALAKAAGKPGDDPELRKLVDKAAAKNASRDDLVSLARRFLPVHELFGGTSKDRVDFIAASELLNSATGRFPEDTEVRLLASRVAFVTQDLYLSLRYLEEAEPLLVKRGASRDERVTLATELAERSFVKLQQQLKDVEDLGPATAEADRLRRRFAEDERRFEGGEIKSRRAEVDFELARGLLNAGEVDRAETLLKGLVENPALRSEVTLELAKLILKRSDPRPAVDLLERAISASDDTGGNDTIGSVETEAKLAYALGNALELAGNLEGARKAWRQSLQGWERLRLEYLQRKNPGAAAEPTMEAGKLLYTLGRQADGLTKLSEAIDQNENRDQSYIDALSFLVQRGDVDAATEIFKRAIGKPSRVVSEYVKVYASLWIADLNRRAGRGTEPAAEQFLRTLAARKLHIRPQRVSFWYEDLARFSLGQITYEALLSRADTPGKKAELHFYEAMRRLAEGRSDDAHALWNKVLETKMVEFLEFDMAARYLRTGAPVGTTSPRNEGQTI